MEAKNIRTILKKQITMEFKTFKFYDSRGRRLSIFAEYIEEANILKFFILTCSIKDTFVKKVAREAYENRNNTDYTYNPLIFIYKLSEGEGPRNAFLQFCHDTFFKMIPAWITIQKNMLIDPQTRKMIYDKFKTKD
jgi:hypothetical protein